jgi:hypothetical protein
MLKTLFKKATGKKQDIVTNEVEILIQELDKLNSILIDIKTRCIEWYQIRN